MENNAKAKEIFLLKLGEIVLKGLNRRYEDWISTYPGKVMIVDGDHVDFESNPKDFGRIADRIDSELYGLFSK